MPDWVMVLAAQVPHVLDPHVFPEGLEREWQYRFGAQHLLNHKINEKLKAIKLVSLLFHLQGGTCASIGPTGHRPTLHDALRSISPAVPPGTATTDPPTQTCTDPQNTKGQAWQGNPPEIASTRSDFPLMVVTSLSIGHLGMCPSSMRLLMTSTQKSSFSTSHQFGLLFFSMIEFMTADIRQRLCTQAPGTSKLGGPILFKERTVKQTFKQFEALAGRLQARAQELR